MRVQLFGLIDKVVRGVLPVYQYDSLMMPVMGLRYGYTHQGKLGLRFKFSWEELSNDRSGSLINQALNDLAEQKPEIALGLSLFNVEDARSVLQELIYHMGKFEFPEDSYELLEAYFEAGARAKGKAGVVFESEVLNILGTKILNIKHGASVYDFSCGHGRTLAEAMKSSSDVSAIGNDFNRETVGIGQLFCFMCGLQNFEIQQKDTLQLLAQEKAVSQTFDYVISHPPMGLKLDHEIRTKYGIVRRDATIGFVIRALDSLKEDGKAVVTVSNSVLFQGAATGEIRRTLIEDDLIEAVITLPGGLLSNTAIPVTMLVLNKKKIDERKNKILIIDASSLGDRKRGFTIIPRAGIDQILNYYTEWKEDKKLSCVLDVIEVRENNYNLLPSSYVQMEDAETIIGSVQIDRANYEKSVSTIPLKQLVGIYRGLNTASSVETDAFRAKVIQLSDVKDGVLNLSTVENYGIKTTTKGEEAEIQSGDVLITSRGIAMKFTVVPDLEENGPFYLSANFIGLRPLPEVDPHFLLAFFESPIGESYIRSLRKGASLPILNVKDIQDIPIPKQSAAEMAQVGLEYKRVVQDYLQAIAKAENDRMQGFEEVYSNIGLSKGYKKKS
ncbi:N-6 DNA methylase [Paenibacillus kribbensis]|uniref:N-6 DNA methylase n=1 Tax=Paenibacillus kribbensis TaxID=172713 RepID=UPI002DBC37B1|nr:N-6 DNA methylase [Paenibacillus kribbensis]MEC0235677.1 N-6 DNA methylase [Paenibacillus kribbensis]